MEKGPLPFRRVCELLDVCDQTLRNWVSKHKVPTCQGPRGLEIDALLLDTLLLRYKRTATDPLVVEIIRVVHDRAERYILSGGRYNIEPHRRELERLWYAGLKGEEIDAERLKVLMNDLADHIVVPKLKGVCL